MFGTNKAVLLGLCLSALVLVGAPFPAFAHATESFSSPCIKRPLFHLNRAFSALWVPEHSVAHLPDFKEMKNTLGCFSDMVPLDSSMQEQPLVGNTFEALETPESSETLSQGLMDQLQANWDLNQVKLTQGAASNQFRFGNVATLEAERETILAFLEKVANNLIPSSQNGTAPSRHMGFTFNLDNIPLNAKTLLTGSSAFSVDENLNVLLEDLSITVSNGTLTGETRFNPENMSFEQGAFSINLDIGNAKVSSITTFEKDQGVTKQVLNMTAGLGQLQLHSQVTLSLNSSEFRLGASISDLEISTTTQVDVFGNHSQTFELELDF